MRALEANGFRPRPLPSCAAAEGVSTLAPREVAAELHQALRDPEIDGVLAAIGGWTLLSVLPALDFGLIGEAAKPVVGYSDLTSLINLIPARSGLVAFHGPMVVSEWGESGGPWEYTRQGFHDVLGERSWSELELPAADAWTDEMLWWDKEDDRPRSPRSGGEQVRVVRPGEPVEGRLWGGSLLALSLLLGTPLWPRPNGAVVFLEAEAIAADEFAVRLEQLRLGGVFDGAVALVLGKIGNPRTTLSGYDDFDEVLRALVPARLPVAAGYDLGHTEPMVTLPVGGRARLACPDGGARPELTLLR